MEDNNGFLITQTIDGVPHYWNGNVSQIPPGCFTPSPSSAVIFFSEASASLVLAHLAYPLASVIPRPQPTLTADSSAAWLRTRTLFFVRD